MSTQIWPPEHRIKIYFRYKLGLIKKLISNILCTLGSVLFTLCMIPIAIYVLYKYFTINSKQKTTLDSLLDIYTLDESDYQVLYKLRDVNFSPFYFLRQRFLHNKSLLCDYVENIYCPVTVNNKNFDNLTLCCLYFLNEASTSKKASVYLKAIYQTYRRLFKDQKELQPISNNQALQQYLDCLKDHALPPNASVLAFSILSNLDILDQNSSGELSRNPNPSNEILEIEEKINYYAHSDYSIEPLIENNTVFNQLLELKAFPMPLALQQVIYSHMLTNFVATKNLSYLLYGEELICLLKLNRTMPYLMYFLTPFMRAK